ncbi:hypothetical protein BaRGS_00012659 [Batillaria attramentaria]|uniref:Secreted protein n=1 Tax=Batillaria attramentaria TaxID=370345 RepID=A0ABD0L9T3_9CAEN
MSLLLSTLSFIWAPPADAQLARGHPLSRVKPASQNCDSSCHWVRLIGIASLAARAVSCHVGGSSTTVLILCDRCSPIARVYAAVCPGNRHADESSAAPRQKAHWFPASSAKRK